VKTFRTNSFIMLLAILAGMILAPWAHSQDTTETHQVEKSYKAGKIDIAEMERRVSTLMRRDDMVGLSIAIVEEGQLVHAKGYGRLKAGSRARVSENTVFRWASLSKSVAAATARLLVDDGHFTLDSPVQAYAPSVDMPDADNLITLEDLLSHRTGIVRNAYDTRIEDGRDPKIIRASLAKLSNLCEPGTCHGYQNVLFDAVAEMTEMATDLPYKAVVNERIFEPLNMSSATTTLEGLSRSSSWAKPHNRAGREISRVKKTYYRVPAAAGVNSSIVDMSKWMMAMMEGNHPNLPAHVREDLITPRVWTPLENRRMRYRYRALSDAQYALGWRVYDYGGRKVVGHRGAVSGYRSHVMFDPELKTGIAMMWNSDASRPNGLPLEIFDQVYKKPKRDWLRLSR